ncbi:MAG TPA: hypothetical protein VLG68_09640, partial [Gammaproteobacteria bacterium]|nr:hypothetical protein [Gammaproteobacteria bacterium]
MRLIALIRKELLLLRRDWHALMLLFVMPAVFILVMSMVLQNAYALHRGASFGYYLVDGDGSPVSQALVERLGESQQFMRVASSATPGELLQQVQGDREQFLVRIPPGFGAAMTAAHPLPVKVSSAPGVEPSVDKLFEAELHGVLAR